MVALAAVLASVALAPNPCDRRELRLMCPNLVMAPPSDLHLLPGPRRGLLASETRIVNIGAGPLEIRGRRTGHREMAARQVLRAAPGGRDLVLGERAELYFKGVPSRGGFYWKFLDAARMELWALDAAGHRTVRVRTGPKIFYCFRDLRHAEVFSGGPSKPAFGACHQSAKLGSVTLGTSSGWADVYPADYPGNWINVAHLRGCFSYVLRADPRNVLVEESENDNSSARTVRLPWRGGAVRGCPAAPLPA